MIARRIAGGAMAAVLLAALGACDSFGGGQARYDSPEEAGEALLAAAESGETSAMLRVLGEEAVPVIESGDPIEDANNRDAFVALYTSAHRWVSEEWHSLSLWSRMSARLPLRDK